MDSSRKQEQRVAQDIGGRAVPASGAFWSRKGDARSDECLVEAKRTDKASISIKKQVWEKIRREALLDARYPVMALQIQDRNLAVLDWEDFLVLYQLAAASRDMGEGELS